MSFKPHSNPKPVVRIELSEKHKRLRTVLMVLLLIIGVSSLAYGVYRLLRPNPGWQQIEASCDGINVSSEFTVQYNFSGDSGQRRQLSAIYSDAAEKAYWIFTSDQPAEGFSNLYTINRSPNKVVTVDPALYSVFQLMEQYGSRNLYLGPVYSEYNNLFLSQSDEMAATYNPRLNEDAARYIRSILTYSADPQAIRLELLENNQVILHVSDAYLLFAEEMEIEDFLDFHFMKNAFIVDYLAARLQAQGFTSGFVASYDGFTRNLSSGEERFSMNLFDFRDNTVYPAGTMSYQGPMSLVNLRSFPMMEEDRSHYYMPREGRGVTSYIDPKDGLCRSSAASLTACSSSQSCGEILLQILPLYISDSLDTEALSALDGISCLWSGDETIFCNDTSIEITDLLITDALMYQVTYVK